MPLLRYFLIFMALQSTYAIGQNGGVLSEWRGEALKENYGALYFKTRLVGFKTPIPPKNKIAVTLYDILAQKSVLIAQTQNPVEGYPREMWQVLAGKFRLDRIELFDGAGRKRTWTRAQNKLGGIIVHRYSLSNLGVWSMTPEGESGLGLKIEGSKNTYVEATPRKNSNLLEVIDGFTGTIQDNVLSKRAASDTQTSLTADGALHSVTTTRRQIGMFLYLDLFRHNRYSRDVLNVLSNFDAKLRTCYIRALSANPSLRGTIVYNVLISERTGTMRQVKRSGGSLTSQSINECLVNELIQIPVQTKRNMLGELKFVFYVK